MHKVIHISTAKEVERNQLGNIDLRTRAGREHEVVMQVENFGGFTIFWATENQKRAHALERLIERGRIESLEKTPYPWCSYIVCEPNRPVGDSI